MDVLRGGSHLGEAVAQVEYLVPEGSLLGGVQGGNAAARIGGKG